MGQATPPAVACVSHDAPFALDVQTLGHNSTAASETLCVKGWQLHCEKSSSVTGTSKKITPLKVWLCIWLQSACDLYASPGPVRLHQQYTSITPAVCGC
jgi:hypothetical protein